VRFTGLPSAPLRLVFDRRIWTVRNEAGPNGTQSVYLENVSGKTQTVCEVPWEIDRAEAVRR